jgi:ligand-binding SRPBCC domain-containing protein
VVYLCLAVATFQRSVIIDASVGDVFAFHEREDALSLLTPRFPPTRIIQRAGSIQPGARVELRAGGIIWVALHTAYEKDRLFIDEQVQGPFAKWIHRHEFEDLGVATRLTDSIDFLLPGGEVVNTLFGWIVKLGLHQMFRQRHEVTRRICEG